MHELKELKTPDFKIFDKPVRMRALYTPNDLKRRDMPAVLDSIFHCMERAGIIADDCLVHDLTWLSYPKDVETSGVEIELMEIWLSEPDNVV